MIRTAIRAFHRAATSRKPVLLTRYNILPYDIFRIQNGREVRLREFREQQQRRSTSFDFKLGPDSLVHPTKGEYYQGPNGCSVRPMGNNLLDLVDIFDGDDVSIFRIPERTQLPPELVLVKEHTDHHALQCTEPMSRQALDTALTRFFQHAAQLLSHDEFWKLAYGE